MRVHIVKFLANETKEMPNLCTTEVAYSHYSIGVQMARNMAN